MLIQKWSEIKARNFTPEQVKEIRHLADVEILKSEMISEIIDRESLISITKSQTNG